MRFSISETAKLSGVSIRTLHYYDEIGLLPPSMIAESGYRYYDELALEKLQQILFYRELDFTLKEITAIMNASEYNKADVLRKQKELLVIKRKRLDKLIDLLDANMKGEKTVSFKVFDNAEIEEAKTKYAQEVKKRWGSTDAYAESQKKTSKYSKEDWEKIMNQSDEIMREFAKRVDESPASPATCKLVERWRSFISEYYYECTKEILAGLGQMYVSDERYKKNIDKFGAGTAQFMSQAIESYCMKQKS